MSTALAENAGLGPCELQDPVWPKMSTVAGAANKKKKKSEVKPQSQILKCLNEKRRREQENRYIDELAQLISASFADMNSLSVKPDKCAILQETVNQIQRIKQQEGSANSDAVQQGEVSSSKPTILANEVFGPLLLEALEGFLFVINGDRQVEFVTDNVSQFIKFSKEEVLGESIYNFIHHGDHAHFSSTLLPMSIGWPSIDPNTPRSRTVNCRLLIKSPRCQNETMEEKQRRVEKYENMQISSTHVPYLGEKSSGSSGEGGSGSGEDCGEMGPWVMCIARRMPNNEKQLGMPIEQFTMKLDTSGKIIGVDTSGVSSTYSQYLNKDLINRLILELCHVQDHSKLSVHLKETLTAGHSTSSVYRLRVSSQDNKYIHVQTKSKYFKASEHDVNFIMATHSIIGDNELAAAEASSPPSVEGKSSTDSSIGIGGPLISNGAPSDSLSLKDSLDLKDNDMKYQPISSLDDFVMLTNSISSQDIPTSTYTDLMGTADERSNISWGERPESRQSLTSAPSPPYSAPSQRSPAHPNLFNLSLTPEPPPSIEEGKENIFDKGKEGEGGESARLRNLLTKRPSTDGGNRHVILKNLLHSGDDDEEHNQQLPSTDPPTPKVSSGNNMLLKLLNEKSDDDHLEAKAGIKKQNELLQQLLKPDEENKCHMQEMQQVEDPILKSLGFKTGSPSPPDRPRKRPSEEGDDTGGAKRTTSSLQVLETIPPVTVSSSGTGSKLWEKNKMLASLLAKQPSTPTTIPPIPASVISATPQDKLPRVVKQVPAGWSGGGIQQNTGSVLRTNQQPHLIDTLTRRPQNLPAPQRQFVNQLIEQQAHQQQQTQHLHQQQQLQRFDYQTGGQEVVMEESSESPDRTLSDILDEVIDFINPDVEITDPTTIMTVLSQLDPIMNNSAPGSGANFQPLNEMMAINAIQKSLMQCETVVKGPPVYNTTTMPSNQQQFPPPMYQQRPRFSLQAQLGARQGSPNYLANQQQMLLQRTRMLQQQQKRLLQQQQQQSLLIPSNATAPTSDPGLHNIDSLINSVAPNVSLQRSSSVPDSQLSPSGYGGGGGGPLLKSGGSQISPSQRQPYSPLSHQSPAPFSPVNGGMSGFQQQSQQQQQQQQAQQQGQSRLSPSGLTNFQQNSRVSQGQQVQQQPSQQQSQQQTVQQPQQQQQQQQQQQANYPVISQAGPPTPNQNHAWSSQGSRLTLQQQQNPMLNAQLTGGAYNTSRSGFSQNVANSGQRGATQLPPVRSLTSPGSRQSPFPPDVSPTSVASYQPNSGQFRLQRTISAPPQATTQLPGGVRQYSAGLKDHTMPPSYPPHHHHHHPSPHHLMYPPDSPQPQPQFVYDQAALQYYGASCDRGRQPSAGNNGMTEYVRQELRAMVGARTSGGSGPPRPPSQQIQVAPGHLVPSADFEALGLTFEMPTSGGSESPKLWATVGSDLSPQQPPGHLSRTSMDDVSRSSDQKASSLLQKLLSE